MIFRGGENSTGEMGNFHSALTKLLPLPCTTSALRLNQRPIKTLGFQTPASNLQASVASTV
jgi:hypothetical protein